MANVVVDFTSLYNVDSRVTLDRAYGGGACREYEF